MSENKYQDLWEQLHESLIVKAHYFQEEIQKYPRMTAIMGDAFMRQIRHLMDDMEREITERRSG